MIGAASQAGRLTQQQRDDQLRERGIEVLTCLVKGTHSVQVDFTKGQLVRMLDPPRYSLNRFTLLNKGARAAVFAGRTSAPPNPSHNPHGKRKRA